MDPPEISAKSKYTYKIENSQGFWIFKNNPNKIITRENGIYKSINIGSWTESTLSENFKYPGEDAKINSITIAVDEPTEKDNWKAEFFGKYTKQKRTFKTGQGLVPTGSVTKFFKVFSGDIIFSVSGEKIFKQYVENFAKKIEIKTYPEIGLIVLEYTNVEIYPRELMYFIKINPFPTPAIIPSTAPPDRSGLSAFRRQ
jgi:hypothetical protein